MGIIGWLKKAYHGRMAIVLDAHAEYDKAKSAEYKSLADEEREKAEK